MAYDALEASHAIRPDRVGQDVEPVDLDEDGGVVHEGHAQRAASYPCGRWRAGRRVSELAPGPSLITAELALEPIEEPDRERLGLMKLPPVEMSGHGPGRERERAATAEAEREAHRQEARCPEPPRHAPHRPRDRVVMSR